MLKKVFIENEYKGWTRFAIVFAFCFTFILSLVLADVPYMDDLTRMDNGNGYWEYEGRPLTTLLIALLNFNFNPIYNIGPIPLIFGTLFFAYSVCYATSKMDIKQNLVNILPFTLLACNPYFIQNLSYQFDSIGNLFSVAFILFAFFYKHKNIFKTYAVQVLCLVIVSSLYQPTINMYIALFAINILFQFKKTNDKFFRSVFYYSSVFILSSLIYYIGCQLGFKYFYPEVAYRSDMITPTLSSLIFSYDYSIKELIDMNQSFRGETMFWLVKISAVMLVVNMIIVIFKGIFNKEYTQFNKIMLTIGVFLVPVILFISIWGPFIVLKELFFNPRDFPVAGVFFMGGAMSFYFLNVKGYLNMLFIGTTLLGVCGFSFVYGSALKHDYNYKTYVYDSIAMKMEDHIEEVGDKKVNIYGRPATSSFVRLALVEHNFIYRLIYADNTNFFKKYNLGARTIPNIVGGFVLDDLDEWNMICDQKIKPMVSNRNYDIFNFNDHVSIWFKRTPKFCENYPLETDIHFSRKQDVYQQTYGDDNK